MLCSLEFRAACNRNIFTFWLHLLFKYKHGPFTIQISVILGLSWARTKISHTVPRLVRSPVIKMYQRHLFKLSWNTNRLPGDFPIGGFHSRLTLRRWVIIPTLQGGQAGREDILWGQKTESSELWAIPDRVSSFMLLALCDRQRNCEDWTWFS